MSQEVARRALPSIPAMLGAIGFGALAQGATVALLATSAWLITRAAEQPPILFLTLAIVAVRAFALSRAVFRYLERLAAHSRAFRALEDLRVWIYRRLIPLAPAGLQDRGRGDVLSTVVRDVDTLQDYPLRVVQPVASALVVVVAAVGVLAAVHLPSTLVLVAVLGLSALVSVWWNQRIAAQAERDVAPARAQLADWLMDSLQRRAVLAAYGAEDDYDARAMRLDAELRGIERKVAWGSSITAGVFVALSGLAVVLVALTASVDVQSGAISGPVFALLVLTPLALFEVFQAVPMAVSAWRGVQSSAGRIAQLVPDTPPAGIPEEVETAEMGEALSPVTTLVLDGVHAEWPGQSGNGFEPVSIAASARDRVLIEGPSGVGKSTLASALVGFLHYSGSIQIDGRELRSLPLAVRRATVMLIEQRPHLFDTTIRHNLSFAAPSASDERLLEVLEQVGLADWVEQRGGLDTPVGEAGALVSGGQAQRIALARAFLAEAPIIILDEPTANVDRAVADRLMEDLLTSVGRGSQQIALVISHVPVSDALITQRLRLKPAEV